MVLVVQDVEEVAVERVDVVDAGEVLEDLGELLVPRGLGVLDLAHVELADAGDGVAAVDYRGGLALRAGQDDVDEVLRRGHLGDGRGALR